jgi:hypothetical protein
MSSPTSRPMSLGSNIRRPSLLSIILDSDSKPPESSDSRQSGSLDSKSPESLHSRQSGSLDSKSPESLDSKSPESLDSKPPVIDLIQAHAAPTHHPIKWPQEHMPKKPDSSMTRIRNMRMERDKTDTKPVPSGMSIRQFGENVLLDWVDPIKKAVNAIGAPGSRVRPAFKNIGTAVGVAAEIFKRNRDPGRRYGQGKTKKKKKNKKTFINTLKKAYKNRKTKKCKSKKCHKKSRRK